MADIKRCTVCGYTYNSDDGEPKKDIAPGTLWEDIPDDFKCPLCGAGKNMFR